MSIHHRKRVQAIGTRILDNLDELARTPCPKCHCNTLDCEFILRSGVRFRCEGWDATNPDEKTCQFEEFVLVTTATDLPAEAKVGAKSE